jgi:hypothetical protein
MSTRSGGLRPRIGGLLVEATMVVFAVLVALALEEWRQEQRLLDFAARAETSVVAELQANLEELDGSRPSLLELQEVLIRVVTEEDLSLLGDQLDVQLPDLSSAAWEVAQSSEAAPYFDYEWVIEMARAYEILEVYENANDNIIAAMSAIIGRGATLERVGDVFGWLVIINDVHRQTEERLRAVLENTARD